MSARRFTSSMVALLLVQGLSLPLIFAQTTATVKGRIADTDGTGIPNVPVAIRSKSQPSGNKSVMTDIEGNYRIPVLPPADDYMIRVDYPGFSVMELGPLDLDAGKTTVADLTLRTQAESTETIVVESRGNIVDTESTKTSSTYNAEFIEGLPIIGSNYQDILTLAPGVTDTDGDGNPNVHGARDTGLQYRLDGGNITDPASGTFGQNLNPDIIEELEVITSGASAEYGRADGGFANIITKSGGNEFEGKFSIRWRGKFLSGEVADNNDINRFEGVAPDYRDIRPILSLGGAVVKDKLWYFGSLEILDTEVPVNQLGNVRLSTSKGHYGFAKLTWQVDSYNKLAFQVNTDPRDFTGNNIDLGTSLDSDFEFSQGGVTPQIKWTSTISPQLLLESQIARFQSGISITPLSSFFAPTEVELAVSSTTTQARYPCKRNNCDPAAGETGTYQTDILLGTINGPFFFANDDVRTRTSIKTDLSYNIEDAWGQHNIKSGIEFADESFKDAPITNPFLVDDTEPFQSTLTGQEEVSPDAVSGLQQLLVSQPLQTPQLASSFNSSIYALDGWKPRPNLTINVGLRVDREDVDTSGFNYFDPRDERREKIGLWSAFCAEARAQQDFTGLGVMSAMSNCQNPGTYDGKPPTLVSTNQIVVVQDRNNDNINDVDPRVIALDLNGDGRIATTDGKTPGFEAYELVFAGYTRFVDRQTSNFPIVNTNLSPRFSISWDPWADGKTKMFGSAGRFYDRLFLDTISGEIGPDTLSFIFTPSAAPQSIIFPGKISQAASTISINQIDRNISTPYTDEWTIGIERELAPEWSASITYINRKGVDLLQDLDINHLTCPQHDDILSIDPDDVCEGEFDKFGRGGKVFTPGAAPIEGGNTDFNPGSGANFRNSAPDLYTVSPRFNQILRVGNFNDSQYEAIELKVVKRLHRNWQMQASYTLSEAFGQAEFFGSALGNDPETVDDEEGYLDFDQRHVLKFQAVTRLPHEISLGTAIQWASGLAYSLRSSAIDVDSTGNTNFRSFFTTGQRNDQRNEGIWKIDGRLEKNFVIGRVQVAGFLNVENLLDEDNLIINEYNITAFDGFPLDAQRTTGRLFEIGAIFTF